MELYLFSFITRLFLFILCSVKPHKLTQSSYIAYSVNHNRRARHVPLPLTHMTLVGRFSILLTLFYLCYYHLLVLRTHSPNCHTNFVVCDCVNFDYTFVFHFSFIKFYFRSDWFGTKCILRHCNILYPFTLISRDTECTVRCSIL